MKPDQQLSRNCQPDLEGVLSEMRRWAKHDQLIAEWVRRIEFTVSETGTNEGPSTGEPRTSVPEAREEAHHNAPAASAEQRQGSHALSQANAGSIPAGRADSSSDKPHTPRLDALLREIKPHEGDPLWKDTERLILFAQTLEIEHQNMRRLLYRYTQSAEQRSQAEIEALVEEAYTAEAQGWNIKDGIRAVLRRELMRSHGLLAKEKVLAAYDHYVDSQDSERLAQLRYDLEHAFDGCTPSATGNTEQEKP